ncbi:MAG: hypothetical protein UY50_C0024G0013 [Parcubacteria group bacterium GW2011_GWA2_49_9]|nr:MAG: hypothetical protein UY50_C0024G0013 [Parcubacteria group bacterium GW2011_GWA2_49_9]
MKKPNVDEHGVDIAEIMAVAEKIVDHTNQFQAKTVEQAGQIEGRVSVLEKEVSELKLGQ